MNNVFSLFKNIAARLMQSKNTVKSVSDQSADCESGRTTLLFFAGGILLTILYGMLIPSSVITASPAEFITPGAYRNPVQYIVSTTCISAGFFLLWFTVFYYICSEGKRWAFSLAVTVLSGLAMINFLLFGRNTVNLSAELVFDYEPDPGFNMCMINLLVLAVAAVLIFFCWKKFSKRMVPLYIILSVSLIGLSAFNLIKTEKTLYTMGYLKNDSLSDPASELGFTLSGHGKNVVVIMLDRAIGGYLPFALTEKPELLASLDGFTYYPNTISYGGFTMFGAPALFGGYEYTVPAINSRPDELLVDKHNQALCLMPILFSQNGYKTSVYDPPYANYKEVSDLSIYDPYPEITARHLKYSFSDPVYMQEIEKIRQRSFFMYSFYKTSPLILQHYIYDDGSWHYPDISVDTNTSFNASYSVLKNLPALTTVEESGENTFMLMDSETPHTPYELQLPEYVPSPFRNNTGLEPGYRTDSGGNTLMMDSQFHYHAFMATFLQLGKWFDFLREAGVYDNTRIILVADHGKSLGQFDNLILDEDGTDAEGVYPLLMVKDFYASGFSVSDEFMTNADTPTLAMKNLIDHPINPFTGKEISAAEKEERKQLVTICDLGKITNDDRTFDTSRGSRYTVHDSIFERSNWEKYDYGMKETE